MGEQKSTATLSLNLFSPQPTSLNVGKRYRVMSLFSGCGGMDLGFEGGFLAPEGSVNEVLCPDFVEERLSDGFVRLQKTKFQTVFANDILPEAAKTWVRHFAKIGYDSSLFYTESIVNLVKKHRESGNIFPADIDVVIGGFPCQDFSVSGKRKGLSSLKSHNGKSVTPDIPSVETRGMLYFWMKEVIEIVKPKIFIAENVKGLTNFGEVKDIIQKDFSSADGDGYLVLAPRVLHSADYGVPQSRERVIFIGIRKDALNIEALKALTQEEIPAQYSPYPEATHNFRAVGEHLKSFQTIRNAFAYLEEPEQSTDPSQMVYSKAKYMGKHCQGQTEVALGGIGPTIRSEHHGNIEFRRLSAEHGGGNKEELERGLQERRLTPRECAMIQTFPPDYEFVIKQSPTHSRYSVSASGAYKVIGNAVPPVLAYNIAKRIESVWELYFRP